MHFNFDLQSYAAILTIITTWIVVFNKLSSPKFNKKISSFLKSISEISLAERIASCNQMFLTIFERLYITKKITKSNRMVNINRAIWLYILIATCLSVCFLFGFRLMSFVDKLDYFLRVIFFGAFASTVAIVLYEKLIGFKTTKTTFGIFRFTLLIAGIIACFFLLFDYNFTTGVITNATNLTNNNQVAFTGALLTVKLKFIEMQPIQLGVVDIGIIIGTIAGVLTGITTGYISGAWAGLAAGILAGALGGVFSNNIIQGISHIKPYSFIKIILLAGLSLVIVGYIAVKVTENRNKIAQFQNNVFDRLNHFFSPSTLITSAITISILTIIVYFRNPDTTISFIGAIIQGGWVYLMLNVLADSFSIMETYEILKWAGKSKSLVRFIVLIIFDLVISAIIFLIIPVSAGTATIMEAITFKGQYPWIGILFWSTFSTSVLFYLFTLSSLLLTAGHFVLIIFRLSFFHKKPLWTFAFMLYFIFTIGFLAEAII